MSNQNYANLEHDIDFKNVYTDENLCIKPECTFHIHQLNSTVPRWHCMAHHCQEQACNVYRNFVSYPCGIPVFQCLAPCGVLNNNNGSYNCKQDLQPNRKENQHCTNKKSLENTMLNTHIQETKNSEHKYEFPVKCNKIRHELQLNKSNGQTWSKDDHNTSNKNDNDMPKNRIDDEETFEKSSYGNAESSDTECRHTNFLSMILAEKLVGNKTSVVHVKCNNCETSSKGVMIFIPIEGDLFNCSYEKYCKSSCSSKTSIMEGKSAAEEKELLGKYEEMTLSETTEKRLCMSKVFVQKHLSRDQVYTQCKYCESFSQGKLIFLPSPVDMRSKENLRSDNTEGKQKNFGQQEDVRENMTKVNFVSKVFVQTFADNRANQIYVQCKVCKNISRGIFIFLSSTVDYFDIDNINCLESRCMLLKRSENYTNFKENCVSNQEPEYILSQSERNHKCKKCTNLTDTEHLNNIINGSMKHMKRHTPRHNEAENSGNECLLDVNNVNKVIHGKTNKQNQRVKQSAASFILNSIHPGKNNSPDSTEKNVCCKEDIMGLIPFYCNKCNSTDNDVSNESCVESVSGNSENTHDSCQ